jgi:hypothetical protein
MGRKGSDLLVMRKEMASISTPSSRDLHFKDAIRKSAIPKIQSRIENGFLSGAIVLFA